MSKLWCPGYKTFLLRHSLTNKLEFLSQARFSSQILGSAQSFQVSKDKNSTIIDQGFSDKEKDTRRNGQLTNSKLAKTFWSFYDLVEFLVS